MSFTAPWLPILGDKSVQGHAGIDTLRTYDVEPKVGTDRGGWTRSSLQRLPISSDPAKEEVVWDVLLNFWRVKKNEPQDKDEKYDVWLNYFLAWEVRVVICESSFDN